MWTGKTNMEKKDASIGVLKHMLLHSVLKEQDHPRPLFLFIFKNSYNFTTKKFDN